VPRSQCCHQFPTSCYLGDIDKSPSHPAVPHGGDASSEAASQAPVHDWNYEPAISETSSQKLREEVQYMSSQVLNSIDWLSPSVVLCIPMYRSQVLLPPSSELEGMITKAYEALEGRVIRGTTTNLSKETVWAVSCNARFFLLTRCQSAWESIKPQHSQVFWVCYMSQVMKSLRANSGLLGADSPLPFRLLD